MDFDQTEKMPTGSETILFVDDEAPLVNMAGQILERLGYKVETFMNPVEALEKIKSDHTGFDLVITDMTMPQMTGDRLVEEILKVRPDMPIVLCPGFSEKISAERARELGIRKYIEKPLIIREFATAVREALDEKSS